MAMRTPATIVSPQTGAMIRPYTIPLHAPFPMGQITADSANGRPAMTRSTPKGVRSIDRNSP